MSNLLQSWWWSDSVCNRSHFLSVLVHLSSTCLHSLLNEFLVALNRTGCMISIYPFFHSHILIDSALDRTGCIISILFNFFQLLSRDRLIIQYPPIPTFSLTQQYNFYQLNAFRFSTQNHLTVMLTVRVELSSSLHFTACFGLNHCDDVGDWWTGCAAGAEWRDC